MATFPKTLALTAALVIVSATSAARADESSNETFGGEFRSRVAEQLFAEGRQLMEAGEFAEACGKFEQSQKLDPGGGTLLNLAVCHEHQGRTATAWREYIDARQQARVQGRVDRETLADRRLQDLEPKLARVELAIPRAVTTLVRIELDGASVPPEVYNVATPVDPGAHEVLVHLPSRTVVRRFEAEPARTLKLSLKEDTVDASAREAAATPPVDASPRHEVVVREPRTGMIVGGIATLGVGIFVTMAGLSDSQSETQSVKSDGQLLTAGGVVMDLVGATLLVVGLTTKTERRIPYQARAGAAAFTF